MDRIKNEKIEFLGIFSDGVTEIESLDWKEVVAELFAFKNTAGEFVKRRAISFLKKLQNSNAKTLDDLSMGVIHVSQ